MIQKWWASNTQGRRTADRGGSYRVLLGAWKLQSTLQPAAKVLTFLKASATESVEPSWNRTP